MGQRLRSGFSEDPGGVITRGLVPAGRGAEEAEARGKRDALQADGPGWVWGGISPGAGAAGLIEVGPHRRSAPPEGNAQSSNLIRRRDGGPETPPRRGFPSWFSI